MTVVLKTGGHGEVSANESTAFYSPDTEKATIGAAMLSETAAKIVADLPDDTFANNDSIAAHKAIRSLVMAGNESIDYVAIENAAKENGSALDVMYLVDCADKCPTAQNIRHYVEILTGCAARRRLRNTAQELLTKSGDATVPPEEIREWCARQLREVRSGNSVRLISMAEAASATYKAINDAMRGDSGRGISTGVAPLDNLLGGFKPGEMVVVGARPSVGKSILALTFCTSAARTGKRVLLISLEMSETEITERILANVANVPLNEMTNATVSQDHLVAMGQEIGKISRLPMWYCLEATTVEQVRKAAYQLYENGGLDMIAVDYLQLMEASFAKGQNRQEQISEISRGLRKLSMELNIPIIVLSQLNRSSEGYSKDGQRTQREPTMSQARESGSIEQDANIFILLHNPRRDEMSTEDEFRMWDAMKSQGMTLIRLIVDKNRQGRRGRMLIAFDGEHMRFLPIDYRN